MNQDFWLTMSDGVSVYVKKWYKQGIKPKAIVQLSHGMAEHINRYDDFANFLLEHDIFVYGNDHRGHGRTGERQGLLGFFADEDGFAKTAHDLTNITALIKQEYGDVPLFLLGHSMGSFLARAYIQEQSYLINGVMLLGTRYQSPTLSHLAQAIAEKLPARKESRIMNTLSFSAFNLKIKNKDTSFDWLTRDEEVVKQYIADPLCGFIPTARFFYDLMEGMLLVQDSKKNAMIRKDLPVFILSGDADPVGQYGNGVFKVANLYHDSGLTNVKTMLFKEARHELLHETNQTEVYHVILNWLKTNLS